MLVAFDATPLQTGHRDRGIGTYTRSLLAALLAHDPDTQYLVVAHGSDGLPPLPPNARLVHLPRPRFGRFGAIASHQLFLPAVLSRVRADLFHSPGFVAAFSVPGIPWRCPFPMVLTLHDFIPVHLPAISLHKPINRWWYARQCAWARHASRFICVSQATLEDAVRILGVDRGRCSVVYEGVDGDTFYPRERDVLQQPYILFVGGDYPNKNRAGVLAAFAALGTGAAADSTTGSDSKPSPGGQSSRTVPHRAAPEYRSDASRGPAVAVGLPHRGSPHGLLPQPTPAPRLILVGPDARSDAELAAAVPGLDTSRVTRVTRVSTEELARLYRNAVLFLFPSTYEGFGLPVLEAMASGTAVITSTVSSLPEVAGEAALLVDPYDPQAIAQAMSAVLVDSALRARLGEAGLARARQFTWEATARATLEVYGRVAASSAPGPHHY